MLSSPFFFPQHGNVEQIAAEVCPGLKDRCLPGKAGTFLEWKRLPPSLQIIIALKLWGFQADMGKGIYLLFTRTYM